MHQKGEQEAVNRRFGENLRRARQSRGLSQEALAHLANVHRTEIGLLERAKREPRMTTLLKLAAVLEVPPAVLMEGIEWRPPKCPPVLAGTARGGFRVAPEKGEEGPRP